MLNVQAFANETAKGPRCITVFNKCLSSWKTLFISSNAALKEAIKLQDLGRKYSIKDASANMEESREEVTCTTCQQKSQAFFFFF